MRMNAETIKKVNESYKENTFSKSIDLKVDSSLNGVTIYNKNWAICNIEELSDMIEELTKMRDVIADVTGMTF